MFLHPSWAQDDPVFWKHGFQGQIMELEYLMSNALDILKGHQLSWQIAIRVTASLSTNQSGLGRDLSVMVLQRNWTSWSMFKFLQRNWIGLEGVFSLSYWIQFLWLWKLTNPTMIVFTAIRSSGPFYQKAGFAANPVCLHSTRAVWIASSPWRWRDYSGLDGTLHIFFPPLEGVLVRFWRGMLFFFK